MRSDIPSHECATTRRAFLKSLAAATLVADCGWLARSARANDLRVGERAPLATLVTLDGERISTADLLGHVVILTFWATWCSPCREELPLLSALSLIHI